MERRQFLAAAGSCVSLLVAGCPSNDANATNRSPTVAAETGTPAESTPTTPTRTPAPTLDIGDTYETAAGRTITVADVHLRRSVLFLQHPDVARPLVPRNRQFVFLTLLRDTSDALSPEATAFRLLLDDEAYRGAAQVSDVPISLDLSVPNDAIYPAPETSSSENTHATVGFEVPLTVSPDRVAVEWVGDAKTVRWVWDDERVQALGNPPQFGIEAVEFPETFACAEPFDVAVRVANAGGRTGLFHATLGPTDNQTEQDLTWIVLPVPADETATWEEAFRYPPQFGDRECDRSVESATFELDWGVGTRTIRMDRHE